MPANRIDRPHLHLGEAKATVEGKRKMYGYERGIVAEGD
jgi:hypothetical protein